MSQDQLIATKDTRDLWDNLTIFGKLVTFYPIVTKNIPYVVGSSKDFSRECADQSTKSSNTDSSVLMSEQFLLTELREASST
jgi:hypothetical protein